MLDDLVAVLETVSARMSNYHSSLRAYETRTRVALIDPVLTALGWNVSDPSLVTPEYRVDVGWADYMLIGVGGRPAAVIEAKRLGTFLENHLEQAVGYCIQQGIAYAGVTDGNRWQLYRTFEPVPLAEKLVLDLSISNMPAHEAALKLLVLWRPNLASGQPVEANTPFFSELLSGLEQRSVEPSANIGIEIQGSQIIERGVAETGSATPPEVTERRWRKISQVIPKPGDSPPSKIRLADGSERRLRRAWAAVVENTAEWLWANNLLSLDIVPIKSSSRRNIVNTRPLHPGDNEFNQPSQIGGTPLWVERNISGRAAAANARTLLDRCGVMQDRVFLWFD